MVFHSHSPGGQIVVRKDGSGLLDYELTDYIWEGAKRALITQAEIQFAAGAKKVMPLHQDAGFVRNFSDAKKQINQLRMAPFLTRIGTAHLMGGCGMNEDARHGVVNSWGQHHQIENLSIIDGSVFPTSIGANPQLSIYGLAAKFVESIKKC